MEIEKSFDEWQNTSYKDYLKEIEKIKQEARKNILKELKKKLSPHIISREINFINQEVVLLQNILLEIKSLEEKEK